jgi:uncharacterized repeat protein (TIGR03803 family)
MTPGGSLTTLHSFQAAEGSGRQARLTLGPDKNLYGTSQDGGSSNLGTIFKITTNGVYTTLVSFIRTNGAVPFAELARGADGLLYGTTQQGGSANVGTVFKVTTNGALTTLVSFASAANGMPQAGLLLASDGNFYGCSAGAVFKMTAAGALTTLASLYPLSGSVPQGRLIILPEILNDALAAATTPEPYSGSAPMASSRHCSRLTPRMAGPAGGLALSKDGNFYGTTVLGGANGSGTVFRFSTNGALARRLVRWN